MSEVTDTEAAVVAYFEANDDRWSVRTRESMRDWILAAVPHIGADLNGDTINKYLDRKRRQGRSNNTVSLYRRALKSLCQWSEEHGYAPKGEADKIKPYSKVSPLKRDVITHAEYLKIIEVTEINYPCLADPFRVAYWTGLRCFDVYRLAREHIDQAESAIIMVPHKTKRFDRRVCIPIDWNTELGETLLRHLDLAVDDVTPFFTPYGSLAHKPGANLSQVTKDIQLKAGVRKFTFHTFRRTFLTNLMNSGAAPQIATAVSGIKAPEVLMRYVVPQAEGLRRVMSEARRYTVTKEKYGSDKTI